MAIKTTIELPDALLRKAKITAIERGTTLRELITQILAKALNDNSNPGTQPDWLQFAGLLKDIPKKDLKEVDQTIEDAFEQIDPTLWE